MCDVSVWPWPPEERKLGEDAPVFRGVVLNVSEDRVLLIDNQTVRCVDVSMPDGQRVPSNIGVGKAGYLRLRRGHPEFELKPERKKMPEVV